MNDALRTTPRVLAFCLAGCVVFEMFGCTGEIDSPAGSIAVPDNSQSAGGIDGVNGGDGLASNAGDGPGPLDPTQPSKADPDVAGARPLRRLTEVEYNNSLRSLLRDDSIAWQDLGGDPEGDHGFSQPGIDVPTERMLDIAETLSQGAMQRLDALYQCNPAGEGESVCATRFIDTFGRRAYRRPVETEERDALLGLYTKARSDLGFDFAGGVRMLMEAMLMSPRFLYHWQLGGEKAVIDGEAVPLTDFELASRLSYFLWSDMPDDALLDAAEGTELTSPSGLAAHIDRMLADPRAKNTVQSFHTQWLLLSGVLGLSKDTTLFPEWNDDLKRAMVAETQAFVTDVFSQSTAPLTALFSAPYTFVNQALAQVYGIDGIQGSALQRVNLDKTRRGGLLTQLGVLAAQSNPGTTNPARAGKMVLSNLLCLPLDPPPPGATDGFQMKPELSMRDNFARLESEPSCKGCHTLINPLGFAFEQYDAIGHYRTKEGPHTVDASGSFMSRDGKVSFDNLVELGAGLAGTPELRECVARKWLQFALGRVSSKADRYSLDTAFKAFHESDYDVKKLLKALATSRTFRYRAPEAGEVM